MERIIAIRQKQIENYEIELIPLFDLLYCVVQKTCADVVERPTSVHCFTKKLKK